MVGFPGESEAAFSNSYDLIAGLPVTYLHCFSFSGRPGTAAADLGGIVPPEAKKARSRALRDLGKRKNGEFRAWLVGKPLQALVLSTRKGGLPTALSGNYVRCLVEGQVRPNDLVSLMVTNVVEGAVLARPLQA
jgi:threonylcarbamoyladenosine tRNA methylthiotransferase MtaB